VPTSISGKGQGFRVLGGAKAEARTDLKEPARSKLRETLLPLLGRNKEDRMAMMGYCKLPLRSVPAVDRSGWRRIRASLRKSGGLAEGCGWGGSWQQQPLLLWQEPTWAHSQPFLSILMPRPCTHYAAPATHLLEGRFPLQVRPTLYQTLGQSMNQKQSWFQIPDVHLSGLPPLWEPS
jgi:hypothetical protein